MASAKLVNIHSQHHHHRNNHISPSRHHGDVVSRKKSPSPYSRACPSPFQPNPQSPAMTLDYSLPRGRDLETGSPPQHGIQPELDPRTKHQHTDYLDLSSGLGRQGKGQNLDQRSHQVPMTLSDETMAKDDPYSSPPPSYLSQAGEDHDGLADSPTKKNKRKNSSPRRRADMSDDEAPAKLKEPTKRKKKHSKSDRPSSPVGEDEDSGIDSYKSVDDAILDVVGVGGSSAFVESPSLEKMNVEKYSSASDRRGASAAPSSPSSSSMPSLKHLPVSSTPSKSKPKKKSSPSTRNRHPSQNSSSRQGTTNSNSHADTDTHHMDSSPSPHDPRLHHSNLHPNFLHPMLPTAGMNPAAAAALGFVPGLYFGHPGLHPSLPMLPPHLQQAYAAAAAAAAAQASALTSASSTATSSSPSQTPSTAPSSSSALPIYPNYYANPSALPPSMLPSMLYAGAVPRSETTLSEPHSKPPPPHSVDTAEKQPSTKSIAQSSKSQRHQRQSNSSTSPSPQLSHQSKPSPAPSQPPTSSFPSNFLLNPSSQGSSSRSKSIPVPPEPFSGPSTSGQGGDPNDSSSSRPPSPEDLTMPGSSRGSRMSRKHRKNYKNMTRERRVEANARERTRVHTISAAFEALRRAVPSYSHNQKLSKLAILRIACSYIMSLARLGDMDYTSASEHIGQPLDFAECVEMTTNTIQTEGRARRRH